MPELVNVHFSAIMNENGDSQSQFDDVSSKKSRIIVEQSNAVEAGAELTVSSSSSAPDTVTLSTQSDSSVPCTYVSSLNAGNDYTDEDIDVGIPKLVSTF